MSYFVSHDRMDEIIRSLLEEYRIYAPKCFKGQGWKENTDLIRYGEITTVQEIAYNEKSDFSPKEVIYPIMQTMLYFTDQEYAQSHMDEKKILLFARPCDINGIRRLDTIFLKNGNQEDIYYKRMREKLKIFMLECRQGSDTCFCVSMGTNKTNDYSAAVRIQTDGILVEVRDELFKEYFASESKIDFTPEFVKHNSKKVELPVISGKDQIKKVHELEMWKEYNDRCISCGSCNTVCITCSCFDTTDIIYDEASHEGERRRVWSSCMLEDYAAMAGGHNVRKMPGERMRFKTMHKIYDFKSRFGLENMCVGCGRCDDRCPENISFSETISRLSRELKAMEKEVRV